MKKSLFSLLLSVLLILSACSSSVIISRSGNYNNALFWGVGCISVGNTGIETAYLLPLVARATISFPTKKCKNEKTTNEETMSWE